MASLGRLSDSSDEEDIQQKFIQSPPANWKPPEDSSSDDDLEVVGSHDSPHSSGYHSMNTIGSEPSSQMKSFYNYDAQESPEPSFYNQSFYNTSNGSETRLNDSNSSSSNKKSSKKKKEKSSRRDGSPSSPSKKSKKRKSEESSSETYKRLRTSSDCSTISYYANAEETYSTSNPSAMPNLSEDDDDDGIPRFSLQSKEEEKSKSPKKSSKKSSDLEKNDLKTRLDSSNKGNLLMKKMGYREGEGLGKHSQGRVDPVELSKQKGRKGLGLSLPGIDDNYTEWDPSNEVIYLDEPISWLENRESEILDAETMVDSWMCIGPQNLDIASMTEFIDEELLHSILTKKSAFDNLSDEELNRTISRSNPFEYIRKAIFMNRAAVKMANMDSAFDYMFTNPKDKNNVPMVSSDELLYFADVCAGPGGFSEYVLWRKKWRAKGIGFTLKGDCDFKIQDFVSGPSETFEPFYGSHDDGDIYNPENIWSLERFVKDVTKGQGVHFMMADGGFSVKGKENLQELLSKQLYLCQFLVALCIVREQGHFVCKLFDLFSPFSAGLIYLISQAFDKICIFKPNTSRPANSERYIICKHRKSNVKEIKEYLFHINETLWKFGSDPSRDVTEIVPVSIMKENTEFYRYLLDSNIMLGNRQVISLDKVIAFYRDPNLHESQQGSLRRQCLEKWGVPSTPRRVDQSSDMEVTRKILREVLQDKFKETAVSALLNIKGKKLTPKSIKEVFEHSILDWECVPLGSEKLIYLLGLGKNRVYHWTGTRWEHEDKLNIELPPGTLLYGEYLPEYKGEALRQTKVTAFHIIDGLSLGYEIISNHHYDKRVKLLSLFAKSLRKFNNNSYCRIRVKAPTALKDIYKIYNSLSIMLMKTHKDEICLKFEEDDYFIQMKGLYFIRTTKEPWRKHQSKKTNMDYYFNAANKKSFYEKDRPQEAVASTVDSLENQVFWMWEPGVGFKNEERVPDVLHRDDLYEFIRGKC